jgi:hypothetical protein
MNSKQKKITALFQALTKLGHDKDVLFSAIEEALDKDSPEDMVTKTKSGLSIKVPLYVALRQLGILNDLGINEKLFDEDDLSSEEEEEELKED